MMRVNYQSPSIYISCRFFFQYPAVEIMTIPLKITQIFNLTISPALFYMYSTLNKSSEAELLGNLNSS